MAFQHLLPWPGFSNQLFIEYDSMRFFTVSKKARKYESVEQNSRQRVCDCWVFELFTTKPRIGRGVLGPFNLENLCWHVIFVGKPYTLLACFNLFQACHHVIKWILYQIQQLLLRQFLAGLMTRFQEICWISCLETAGNKKLDTRVNFFLF